jgi:hypothetical protein
MDLRKNGDFERDHAIPASGQDVFDELGVGLVVLGIEHPYSRDAGSPG